VGGAATHCGVACLHRNHPPVFTRRLHPAGNAVKSRYSGRESTGECRTPRPPRRAGRSMRAAITSQRPPGG
jgi:hypothetical protein